MSRIDGMDAPFARDGEVQQQRRITANRLVIGVYQLAKALYLRVFILMIEPSRTYRRVALAWRPVLTILLSVHQSVLRHIKRIVYRTPVCQSGVTLLRTNPSQFCTVAPDGQFGLPLVYHLKRFGPIIICGAVYLAFLVCSAVISRAAICSVEPHFEHLAILGE